MRRVTLWFATWILSRIVPKDEREPLIGDLAEEYALRVTSDSSSAALKWYLRQICISIPPLLWIRLTRATWLSTLGVALLAYIAVGVAQLVIHWAIPSASAPTYKPLGLVIVFPLVVFIGYIAERVRRRAAIVLGAMMLLAITAMTVWTSESAPVWYRVAYFFVGPTAALIGSALRTVAMTCRQARYPD
jgi:hypothetical protein